MRELLDAICAERATRYARGRAPERVAGAAIFTRLRMESAELDTCRKAVAAVYQMARTRLMFWHGCAALVC